jgi:hypothetical protein
MREYLVNADFDLSLRPRRLQGVADGRGRQAKEMPLHLLLLAAGGDSVLVDEAPDDAFLAYLERKGIARPGFTVEPKVTMRARFVPFGWNHRAATANTRYDDPSPHPPLEIVERVNGRRFAAEIEEELFGDQHVHGVFFDPAEVEEWMASREPDDGWLVKSDHGNAGLGNRRIRSRALSPSDREVLRRLLAEDSCVLVERWRRRTLDISSVFEVNDRGSIENLEVYEVVNTADGAFIGSLFDRDSVALERWRPSVGEVADRVGKRLAEEGYFGPVCLDHFVWSDEGKPRLRRLADLNARLQVSAPMLRLWLSWNRDRVIYWRLFNARKLKLPTDYDEFDTALGEDAFDPLLRVGTLVTSPFFSAGRRLRRVGVLLSATDREGVDRLDAVLRVQFER